MPPPLLFLPPRLPLSIARPRFTAFLRAFDAPLTARTLAGPAFELARATWGFPASPELHDAVDLLELLGTDAGASAIADASRAGKRRLPLRLAPADLAAVLLTRRASDASLEPVLERALHAFARIVPRALALELVANDPRRAADPALFIRAVESLLGRRFVSAWHASDDATGSIHVVIVRRDRARAAIVARGTAADRRARRDLTADTVRVDVPEGRIVVRCDDPSLEAAYVKAASTSLFGDPSHFSDRPSYTLKHVVLLGSAALAALRPPGVSRVRVVDLTWDDGEGFTHNVHGSDALAAFEKLGGAAGGYVTGAMFRMDAPVASRSIDVAIGLPDRAEYRTARHEPLARGALASLGALTPGTLADDAFTLAPWVHAEWRWRKVLGDALFERMRDAKILVPVKTRMVGDPSVGKYGWSYVTFDLRSEPGTQYAVAMNPRLPSRDLEKDERRMWRLDPAAVARALAADLATEAVENDAGVGGGALDLGLVRADAIALRFFAVLRSPGPSAPALVEAMVRAAGTAHVVVLLPEGKTLGSGGVEIGLTLAELFGQERVAGNVFARVAKKKGLAGIFAPWRFAAPDTRFVSEEKTGRMWLDRCELVLRQSAARILQRTAKEGCGKPVSTSVLTKVVAPNRSDDGVIRQTVPRLGDWIREQFVAKGLQPPADADAIVEFVANKGWKMNVKCEVV